MKGNGYIFGFTTAICIVCSLAVASTSQGLKPLQEINKRWDLRSSILAALDLPEDGSKPVGEQIDQLWDERIVIEVVKSGDGKKAEGDEYDLDGDGDVDKDDVSAAWAKVKGTESAPAIISVYNRVNGGQVEALAIPMRGKGLWGPLSGYLALDARGATVIGATFSAPKETPGLGSEVTADKFVSQWTGKKLVDGGKSRSVKVVKGSAENICPREIEFCVDGVSGATITSDGVSDMVADTITIYDPFLSTLRGGN